ncbi:hypothetical protein Thena_0895 [Thermodesulfobium narugense DSM 14796]|uniref:Uncharacterized protein n=1 Tax=Thermodesulfobium narugense DSM 14796 TaxID=747365 RepID=M1E8K1_9BACT|nr:hypothetical protein Thena_0895 [Thermodesulfobium narugense DSM 14796]
MKKELDKKTLEKETDFWNKIKDSLKKGSGKVCRK